MPDVSESINQWVRNLPEAIQPAEGELRWEIIATTIVLVCALVLYAVASRLLKRIDRDSHLDTSLVATLRIVTRWLFVIITAAAILQVWGVLDQVWAAATALVTLVAIGFFAVWSVLSNVLCSFILLGARPFRIGQRIALPPDDFEGVVVEVTLLHTVLRTDDGGTLKVPNNLFFQRVMHIRPPGYEPPSADSDDSAATHSAESA